MLVALVAAGALAHHPHDPVEVFDVTRDASGEIALYGGLVPNQTWRNAELARSVDGGFEWSGVYIGLSTTSPYTDFRVCACDGPACGASALWPLLLLGLRRRR